MFVIPEYAKKNTRVHPHYNTVDLMYDEINKHEVGQEEWYTYIEFISDNQYDFGGGWLLPILLLKL